MGLVKHLLFWPVTGPKALIDFSLRQIEGLVHRELTDDERVKEDLMALQMELEVGNIDAAEYERRETEIMARLRDTREWRRRLGMEEEWAPLEFKEGGHTEAPARPLGPTDGDE
jgi:hypothetical protein